MISDEVQRTISLWILLAMHVTIGHETPGYGDDKEIYQVKQGVRSQRKVIRSSRSETPLDCAWFCLGEKTCRSFNYAEPSSVKDDEQNCELHEDTKTNSEDPFDFLKDERYTFYQVIQPGSCLDHFNSGRKISGNYTILDWQRKSLTVYCDMESDPGFVWTLIMSYTMANKQVKKFREDPMYRDAPANEYTPNWSNYRMSLNQMKNLRNQTTHWRATCSFPQYVNDIHTDYVRAVFTDFDLMGKFEGECKKASYINVKKKSCSECSAMWWQSDVYAPHIWEDLRHSCYIKLTRQKGYFGYYDDYNTTFRCTATAESTTNYWFGTLV